MKRKFKFIIVITAFIFIAASFYWVQIRPAQIKHDCSWVKQTSSAISTEPAMTEAQLRSKGMIEDCSKWDFTKTRVSSILGDLQGYCETKNKNTIEEYKNGKPAIPSKDYWIKASSNDYQFCLHDKGL